MSNKNRVKILRFKKDEKTEVLQWLSVQTNTSDAIRFLIEKDIYRNEIKDYNNFIPKKRDDSFIRDYMKKIEGIEVPLTRLEDNASIEQQTVEFHSEKNPSFTDKTLGFRLKQNENPLVLKWIEKQTNMSDSIRFLIEKDVIANGIKDYIDLIPTVRTEEFIRNFIQKEDNIRAKSGTTNDKQESIIQYNIAEEVQHTNDFTTNENISVFNYGTKFQATMIDENPRYDKRIIVFDILEDDVVHKRGNGVSCINNSITVHTSSIKPLATIVFK